jgi:hypothetical protein
VTAHPRRAVERPVRQDPDPVVAAKAVAMEFTWSVKQSNWPRARVLTKDMTRSQLLMLAAVLADGISPGDLRLLRVTQAADDEAVA